MRGAALRCGARPGAAVPGSALLGKGEEYLRKGMDFHVCSTGKSSKQIYKSDANVPGEGASS